MKGVEVVRRRSSHTQTDVAHGYFNHSNRKRPLWTGCQVGGRGAHSLHAAASARFWRNLTALSCPRIFFIASTDPPLVKLSWYAWRYAEEALSCRQFGRESGEPRVQCGGTQGSQAVKGEPRHGNRPIKMDENGPLSEFIPHNASSVIIEHCRYTAPSAWKSSFICSQDTGCPCLTRTVILIPRSSTALASSDPSAEALERVRLRG